MMAAKIQVSVYKIYVDMSETPCGDVLLWTTEEKWSNELRFVQEDCTKWRPC